MNAHREEASRFHVMPNSKKVAAAPPVVDAKFCCFHIYPAESKIHRWGLYAGQRIPANRKVIEYRGEKIGPAEADRRGDTPYLFVLDDYWTLDGGVGGSGAELINHSCQPNLVSRIMKGHILYMSLRPIKKGEELTVDYNYDDTDETMNCKCGTRSCRGVINRNE
jgi:SET domain-containing protein